MSGKEQWAELEKEEEEADVIEDSDQESADWSEEEESAKHCINYNYYSVQRNNNTIGHCNSNARQSPTSQ